MLYKKTIDLTEYSKIKVDIFDCTWTDICGYEQVAIICGDKLGVTYKDELEDKIYELDISNVIPNSNIISVQIGNGANGKIRNIWLEK